jgi:hypothetical protein
MVSKDPQPRNVILEEFTGIHCGYCPDGHAHANALVAAYPGKVFLINIHAGDYAVPDLTKGEPDLRTTEGTLINNAAGVTGYPAGSVNRSTTPWAVDRGQWATIAPTILAQTSPVNVAVKSSINFATRELTTEVEYYYTSNSAKPNNYLTVVLTQDSILGYQSDYGNYNPTNWVNGLYVHNHVFRMVLSSNSVTGEKIETTTAGTFGSKKYVTVLPESINDIDMALNHLKVVAFISESQSNILSGAGAEVEFNEALRADLALTNVTTPPTGICFTSINPKLEVTNKSSKPITNFEINAKLDDIDNVKTFNGTLGVGEKTTLDWSVIPFSGKGNYKLQFVDLKNINNNELFDMNLSNNKAVMTGIGFTDKAFSTISAKFDDGIMPMNVGFDQSQNAKFGLVYYPGVKQGARFSTGAVLFYLHTSWGLSGKPGYIILGKAELSKVNNPALSYYYAYTAGGLGGTAPTVTVEVSEDCGATWTSVNSTLLVETGQPSNPNYLWQPTSADYKLVTVSLADYSSKDVLLRVAGIPGTNGNSMFIDDISVADPSGVNNGTNAFNMQVSPNPVSASSVFTYTISDLSNISINLVDVLGNTVRSLATGFVSGGNYSINLNAQGLASGTYYIVANVNDKTSTIPVVISK